MKRWCVRLSPHPANVREGFRTGTVGGKRARCGANQTSKATNRLQQDKTSACGRVMATSTKQQASRWCRQTDGPARTTHIGVHDIDDQDHLVVPEDRPPLAHESLNAPAGAHDDVGTSKLLLAGAALLENLRRLETRQDIGLDSRLKTLGRLKTIMLTAEHPISVAHSSSILLCETASPLK